MNDSVNIRKCTAADASLLAEVAAATFTETFGHLYTPGDLATFLSSSRSEHNYAKTLHDPDVYACLAVDAHGAVMGYALAGRCKLPVEDLEPSAGELRELYVRAECQGQKIGSTLLTRVLESLQRRNRTPLYVGVWSGNLGAQKLYRRFGFEKVGEYDFPVGDHLDREFILKQRVPAQRI